LIRRDVDIPESQNNEILPDIETFLVQNDRLLFTEELLGDVESAFAIHQTIDTHVDGCDRLAISLQLVKSETNLRTNQDAVSLRSFVRCFTK
jgi:hypothetical protein